MGSRIWTLEQRKRQSEMIHEWKPWAMSTGPNTLAGKRRSSLNAYAGGLIQEVYQLGCLLRNQKKLLCQIKKHNH